MSRTFSTFTLTILFLCVAQISANPPCTVATNRVTGKNNLFAVACFCNGGPEFLGRAVRFLDPHTPDTIAQERLTVSCIEKRKPDLAHACQKSPKLFESRAAHALRLCMGKRPKNPTKKGNKKFNFRRNLCATTIRELDAARKESILVCACPQRPGYVVVPGVTQFITEGSPNGSGPEQKIIQGCAQKSVIQLDEACKIIPRRFGLRAAQTFNVCCKRARVKFDIPKLRCQATVPDDVSKLALSFV